MLLFGFYFLKGGGGGESRENSVRGDFVQIP